MDDTRERCICHGAVMRSIAAAAGGQAGVIAALQGGGEWAEPEEDHQQD